MITQMVKEDSSSKLVEAIKACQAKVKAFIAKKVPLSEVDDIFQEIVCNLIKADALNGPIDMAASWLYKAARNEIIDRYRKKKETLLWDSEDTEPSTELMEISALLLYQPQTSEDQYLRQLFWEEFEKALSELPTDQRDVFVETELMGKSYKQLSEEKNVSVNTLLSRKHRAVLGLRKKLLELYEVIVYP
jgi:RNA polymerase sigma factor (sigma-70 family)